MQEKIGSKLQSLKYFVHEHHTTNASKHIFQLGCGARVKYGSRMFKHYDQLLSEN